MKVTIKKATGILVILDNFAQLVEVTDDSYVYELTYQINPVTAIKQSSYSVSIRIKNTPAVKKQTQIFSAKPSETQKINDNILLYNSRQKDLAAQVIKETIASVNSDITNKIPNNLTGKLSNASITSPVVVKRYKTVENVPVSSLDKSNYNLPVLNLNLNKPNLTVASKALPSSSDAKNQFGLQQTNENLTKKLYSTLIYEKGIDPTEILGSKSNSLVSTKSSFDGTISKLPFFNKQIVKENLEAKRLVESFLNTNNSFNQSELTSEQTLPIIVNKEDTFIEKKQLIKISKTSLESGQFYVIFELLNQRGTNVQTESRVVFHSNILEYFEIPVEPPVVTKRAVGSMGKVTFDIKQIDPNASSINVYAKKINPGISPDEQRFFLIRNVPITESDGLKKFEDIVSTINPIIYRFVPVSKTNQISSVFTSILVSFSKNQIPILMKKKRKPYFAKISAKVVENTIQVNVNEVPINAIAVRIYKKDKTFKKTKQLVLQKNLISGDTNISYTDTDIKQNRIYEYTCNVIYKDGTIEQTPVPAIIEYVPVQSNILSFTLENVVTNGNVSFKINFSNIQNSDEIVKTLITQQNLSDQFTSDVTDNKEKLNKLFAFEVKRLNITKGIEENFGILQSDTFSESELGKIKNVKPTEAGNQYQYIITAFIRNPETLFPTLERTVQVRPNITYSFKPYKWYHPITLNNGSIVSDTSLKQNYSKNTFSFGNIVGKNTIEVNLTNKNPTITKINAIKANNNKILLQWQVDSNPNLIDHFIIRLNTLGVYTIIGKSHSISESNSFKFLDLLTNGEKGSLIYYITPIYLDNSSGLTISSNPIVI